MIIDTHCHYNLEPLFSNEEGISQWQTHWQKAQENTVQKSIVVGTDSESNTRSLLISAKETDLFSAIGYHPEEYHHAVENGLQDIKLIDERISDNIAELESSMNSKVVAIGETGLDYFRLPADQSLTKLIKETQQRAFQKHVELAQRQKLPLIIHVRDQKEDAYWDVLKILQATQYTQPFVLHCISGPMEYVSQAVQMGAYVGIAGNVTYKKSDHIRQLVQAVPQDRLLLETDSPFLPPQQFRGQMCEPWMIRLTAEFLTTELNIQADQLSQNAQELFKF
jgi:TatD DNase family protein